MSFRRAVAAVATLLVARGFCDRDNAERLAAQALEGALPQRQRGADG